MQQTLYKRSKLGKVQSWTIETEGDKFRTIEGFVDGAQTTSSWTVCKPKSVGTVKETTGAQQAEKEAWAKVTKQKDKGYTEDIGTVDAAKIKINPMLAHKFPDHKDWILTQSSIAIQPKLDGIRCIATKDGLFTRNGKPITAAPHIWEQVQDLFCKLPNGAVIDGELYNEELKEDFNEISSIVRKQKFSDEDLAKSKRLMQYHIYDIDIPQATFFDRYFMLEHNITDESYNPIYSHLRLVRTTFVDKETDVMSQLDAQYGSDLEAGYEGQMVRNAGSFYENGRSKNLLKRKEFEDQEFPIVDIEPGVGNRSEVAGRIICRLKDGRLFAAGMRGDMAFRKELLDNKQNYIGKSVTIRYQNLTPVSGEEGGKPRFPIAIKIAREDYE